MFLDLFPISGDIFSVQEFVNRRILSETLVRCRARVHEDTTHDIQRGVNGGCLVDIQQELRILYHIHPETQ